MNKKIFKKVNARKKIDLQKTTGRKVGKGANMTDKVLQLAQESENAATAAGDALDAVSKQAAALPDEVKAQIGAAIDASIKAMEAAIKVTEAINMEIASAKAADEAKAAESGPAAGPGESAGLGKDLKCKLIVGDEAAEAQAIDGLKKEGRKIERVKRNGAVRKIYHTA
jgi:hypothetical protein